MVEVEGRACGVKKFLGTLMHWVLLIKIVSGKSGLVIKGILFYIKIGNVRIKLRKVQIHRNTL